MAFFKYISAKDAHTKTANSSKNVHTLKELFKGGKFSCKMLSKQVKNQATAPILAPTVAKM